MHVDKRLKLKIEGNNVPSMAAKDFLINDGGDGQAIEAICKCLPQFDVVAAFTFVIEA
jgi:hypothetical protein